MSLAFASFIDVAPIPIFKAAAVEFFFHYLVCKTGTIPGFFFLLWNKKFMTSSQQFHKFSTELFKLYSFNPQICNQYCIKFLTHVSNTQLLISDKYWKHWKIWKNRSLSKSRPTLFIKSLKYNTYFHFCCSCNHSFLYCKFFIHLEWPLLFSHKHTYGNSPLKKSKFAR